MNHTFTTADGLKLAYYVDDFTDPWRKSDTALLLHAAMGNSQRWFQWMPSLARRYRVVRLDLRGHATPRFRHRRTISRLRCWSPTPSLCSTWSEPIVHTSSATPRVGMCHSSLRSTIRTG